MDSAPFQCQLPPSAGPLADLERRVADWLNANRLQRGNGYHIRRNGTSGVTLEVLSSAAAASGSPYLLRALVRDVYPDHLWCMLEDGSEVLVNKPRSLCVSGYAAYSGSVLTTFQGGGGFPDYSSVTNQGPFTADYLMLHNAGLDLVSGLTVADVPHMEDGTWDACVQTRNRLVWAPWRDTYFAYTPKRTWFLEHVWPPYFTAAGTGGAVSGDELTPTISGGSLIYLARTATGYVDANVDARAWVSETQISGNGGLNVDVGGTFYLGNVTDTAPQRA